jgi:hypothetical protein
LNIRFGARASSLYSTGAEGKMGASEEANKTVDDVTPMETEDGHTRTRGSRRRMARR